MDKQLISMSVYELSSLIKKKVISPVELTKEVIEHAEELQNKINAFVNFTKEKAEKEAQIAEKEILQGKYRGIFHGIPIALKDNIFIKDEITTMGSKIHQNFVANYDATVVAKLKKAGAIFIGKLNMNEYAWGVQTNEQHARNPWDLEKTPGGSSGGSAAAVAINMTMASLGTDTSGSIRIPASACGIVGLKPTFGRVSNYGSFPLAKTQDHIGPMTKTVKDAAILLEIISGFDPKDPFSLNESVESYREFLTGNIKDIVIGIEEDYFFHQIDSRIEKLIRKIIQLLVEQGAKVKRIKIPGLEDSKKADELTILSEAGAIHYERFQQQPNDFGKDIQLHFQNNEIPTAIEYVKLQEYRRHLSYQFIKAFEKVDVIISPTLPFLPPPIGERTTYIDGEKVDVIDSFLQLTRPANLTGIPALSVPCGMIDGMPVGIQIMSSKLNEHMILNVGYAIEEIRPIKDIKPKIQLLKGGDGI